MVSLRLLLTLSILLPPYPVALASNSARCALNLLHHAGRRGMDHLPELYIRASRDRSPEFIEYLFSIIYVESGFNKWATSHRDAYGLMQVTRIAVHDAREVCPNLRPIGPMSELFDSYTNIQYGSCYLIRSELGLKIIEEYADNISKGDERWKRLLIIYNGGYRQLTRYLNNETMSIETSTYLNKVHGALDICRGPSLTTKENAR